MSGWYLCGTNTLCRVFCLSCTFDYRLCAFGMAPVLSSVSGNTSHGISGRTDLICPVYRHLQNSVSRITRSFTNLSAVGAVSPSVLRCRIVAPYVPLRTKCSESVPTADRFVNDRVILMTEPRKHLPFTAKRGCLKSHIMTVGVPSFDTLSTVWQSLIYRLSVCNTEIFSFVSDV